MEGSQVVDLMATIHRLEAKVDVALTQTQARVDEQGRILTGLAQEVGGIAQRLNGTDVAHANNLARLEMAEKSVAGLMERKPPTWPAVASFVVSAVMAILFISAVIYMGPQ